MKEKTEAIVFGRKIQQLRKENKMSQPELAKFVGTSGTIIGRYERGEITPSIEVARKLAEVFNVTVDYLVAEKDIPKLLKDQSMINRLSALESIPNEDRDRILFVVDGLIRDAIARQTYQRS